MNAAGKSPIHTAARCYKAGLIKRMSNALAGGQPAWKPGPKCRYNDTAFRAALKLCSKHTVTTKLHLAQMLADDEILESPMDSYQCFEGWLAQNHYKVNITQNSLV